MVDIVIKNLAHGLLIDKQNSLPKYRFFTPDIITQINRSMSTTLLKVGGGVAAVLSGNFNNQPFKKNSSETSD